MYTNNPEHDYDRHIDNCENSTFHNATNRQNAINKEHEKLAQDPAMIIEAFSEQSDTFIIGVVTTKNPGSIQTAIDDYLIKIATKKIDGEL